MKQCCRCKELKSIDEFGKNKSELDGLQDACKKCRKEYYHQPYIKSKHLQRCKEYKKTEIGKVTIKKSVAKRRDDNPDWYRATNAVNNAVRDGNLAKVSSLTCKKCNRKAHDYHHHKGYSPKYWLDVIPLCRQCHVDITLSECT